MFFFSELIFYDCIWNLFMYFFSQFQNEIFTQNGAGCWENIVNKSFMFSERWQAGGKGIQGVRSYSPAMS